jgi:flagellar protein FlaJ
MPKKTKKQDKKIKKEEIKDYHFLKMLAIKIFGKLVDKYSDYFKILKISLYEADAKILFRTYLSIVFFLTTFVFIISFLTTLAFSIYLGLNILWLILGLIILPSLFSSITFLLYYLYPLTLSKKRKSDIETNLPFALNHMAAIAGSGVPPRVMFKVISIFKEYGEVSKEANKITRNVEVFGMDEITSIKEVASKSPSPFFKDFLQGILTTIQTGGSLNIFLKEEAEKAMFDYRIKRNKYVQQLTIYADFYTALLIAAPLIFVIMLPVLGVMQGELFGLTIEELINLGLISLIMLNIGFLIFLHLTQPKM